MKTIIENLFRTGSIIKAPICAAVGALAAIALNTNAHAEPTRIDVRVLSEGAKFVGSSMGGCLITIRDVETGELLASGKTEGNTGDTELIMKSVHRTQDAVSTEGSSVFSAELDIDEPTHIEVIARGPRAQKQAENVVSATQWVVPGKHITGGDAFRLKIRGFIVDIKTPPSHVKYSQSPVTIDLAANVTLMCGCPIEPGGTWDADKFEVTAIVRRNGEIWKTFPLEYAGAISQFATKFEVKETGNYEATVYAFDPANGNTGVDKTTWILK